MTTGNLASLDFEEGDLTDWTSTVANSPGTIAASTTQAAAGTYSTKMVMDGFKRTYGITSFTAMSLGDTYNIRWYMWMASGQGINNGEIRLEMHDSGGTKVLLTLKTDGSGNISGIEAWDLPGSQFLVADTAITFNLSTWNCIEIAIKSHATAGGAEVFINGVSVVSDFTMDTSGLAGLAEVWLGNNYFNGGMADGGIMYIDAVEVGDEGLIGLLATGGGPLLQIQHHNRGGFDPFNGGFAS